MEYEATAGTKFTLHKAEDVQNHFMVVTGDFLKDIMSKQKK